MRYAISEVPQIALNNTLIAVLATEKSSRNTIQTEHSDTHRVISFILKFEKVHVSEHHENMPI